MMMRHYAVTAVIVALLAACASAPPSAPEKFELQHNTGIMEAPKPVAPPPVADAVLVARGRYLVELLGCGACHTDGALVGEPNRGRLLAGSGIGIAYGDPLRETRPGIVYPPNLTPDLKTGIGARSEQDIVRAIRSGSDSADSGHLPVMPWPAYARLDDHDALAIARYLKSLAPVEHRVPASVAPGMRSKAPYVHFGVYRSK